MGQLRILAVVGAIVMLLVTSVAFRSPLPAASPVGVVAGAVEPDDDLIEDGKFAPDQVVVKLAPGASLAAIANQYHLDPTPLSQFGSRAIYRLKILDGASPVDRSLAMQADLRIQFAEPNFTILPPEWRSRYSWAKVDDKNGNAEQWAPNLMRLPRAHRVSTGAGITVAVLDTGVDATHPDLAGHVIAGRDFVDLDDDPSEVGSYANKSTPAYGHGTHVAGSILTVAPDARIMPVRVLDPRGGGNIWVLAEALLYAADPDGNPDTPDGAQVINLSLSTTRKTGLIDEIINELVCRELETDEPFDDRNIGCISTTAPGIVVVAAAGNSRSDTREYPAAEGEDGLLAVAASTPDDRLMSSSTFGSWVNVAAPGQNIVSTMPQGRYASWSGTSMASALVAGQAALVRSAFPRMDAKDVAERIEETAVEIPGEVELRVDAARSVNGPRD